LRLSGFSESNKTRGRNARGKSKKRGKRSDDQKYDDDEDQNVDPTAEESDASSISGSENGSDQDDDDVHVNGDSVRSVDELVVRNHLTNSTMRASEGNAQFILHNRYRSYFGDAWNDSVVGTVPNENASISALKFGGWYNAVKQFENMLRDPRNQGVDLEPPLISDLPCPFVYTDPFQHAVSMTLCFALEPMWLSDFINKYADQPHIDLTVTKGAIVDALNDIFKLPQGEFHIVPMGIHVKEYNTRNIPIQMLATIHTCLPNQPKHVEMKDWVTTGDVYSGPNGKKKKGLLLQADHQPDSRPLDDLIFKCGRKILDRRFSRWKCFNIEKCREFLAQCMRQSGDFYCFQTGNKAALTFTNVVTHNFIVNFPLILKALRSDPDYPDYSLENSVTSDSQLCEVKIPVATVDEVLAQQETYVDIRYNAACLDEGIILRLSPVFMGGFSVLKTYAEKNQANFDFVWNKLVSFSVQVTIDYVPIHCYPSTESRGVRCPTLCQVGPDVMSYPFPRTRRMNNPHAIAPVMAIE